MILIYIDLYEANRPKFIYFAKFFSIIHIFLFQNILHPFLFKKTKHIFWGHRQKLGAFYNFSIYISKDTECSKTYDFEETKR